MELFTLIVKLGLVLAGNIVQIALAIFLLVVVFKIVWGIVSLVWQQIHTPSHDLALSKVKGVFKRKTKK